MVRGERQVVVTKSEYYAWRKVARERVEYRGMWRVTRRAIDARCQHPELMLAGVLLGPSLAGPLNAELWVRLGKAAYGWRAE